MPKLISLSPLTAMFWRGLKPGKTLFLGEILKLKGRLFKVKGLKKVDGIS